MDCKPAPGPDCRQWPAKANTAYVLKASRKDVGAGAGAGGNVGATVTLVPYTLLLARMVSVTLLVSVMTANSDVLFSA